MNYTLKEYISAYIRLSGLFWPTRYIWRPFGEILEIDRCAVDGGIVTYSQASLSRHLGHTMKQPVIISVWELFLIWVRVIQ